MDERKTIEAIINGDPRIFDEVYNLYFPRLCAYSSCITRDSEAAFEIVQSLFVILWEKRRTLDPDKSLRNYLLRSTHNNSLLWLKTYSRHRATRTMLGSEADRTGWGHVRHSEHTSDPESEAGRLIDSLPPRSRDVVRMNYIEGLKSAEIAERLGISIRTVETILYKSLKKLREK